MCTIAIAWQSLADAPVAVAANRDEAVDRPSRPPGVLDGDPTVIAPQDAEAGGTWIGASEHGLLVAITNRRTDLVGDRSRGLLVRDALAEPDADAAVEAVRNALDRDGYAGFNLLVVDADRAAYLEWDGDLRVRDLDPGVHVIVNAGADDADGKAVRLREALATPVDAERAGGDGDRGDARPESAADWLARAATALRDHEFDVCVHGDGFGTRSSSLLRIGADRQIAYHYADGPPCETDYRPVDAPIPLLEASF